MVTIESYIHCDFIFKILDPRHVELELHGDCKLTGTCGFYFIFTCTIIIRVLVYKLVFYSCYLVYINYILHVYTYSLAISRQLWIFRGLH